MKRIAATILVYAVLIAVVWILGWLIVSKWYSTKFGTQFIPILNYSAIPALISAIICILTENILWKFSVNPPLIIMYTFVIRLVIMFSLSGVFYMLAIVGPESIKADKIAYVLTVFFNYQALLLAHIISNMLHNRLENNK